MKKFMSYLGIAILGGMISLGTYQFLIEPHQIQSEENVINFDQPKVHQTVAYNYSNLVPENFNFTEATNSTVNKVVNVKNVSTYSSPQSFFEYYFGQGSGETKKAVRGIGSGVIITPDGYIVTNYHVIKGASEVEITLNNNKTYQAEVIGSAPDSDIALLKIDAQDLDYISFGDSDHINLGEWVLAVGNPFNLTSTVTAGIISAKGRSLDESNNMIQSFIQTDLAVNPGNSGGALVNAKGELIGINTAITSRTGSYVGYSFAIPSNNVKKIVEDLIEYGNVQKAILGVRGTDITPENYKQFDDIQQTQGFYVAKVDNGSGAQKAGLQEKDVIIKLDDIKIRKFSDLSGYISSKNPGDRVLVTYIRNGQIKTTTVTLEKYEYYRIKEIGVEVINATDDELKAFGVKNGVKINRLLNDSMIADNLIGILITKVDDQPVKDINALRDILDNRDPYKPLSLTFTAPNGESKTYVFR
ncbi:trypsin-like peptidase domain-containing protein [Flavobacterium sp. CS20]|uniref:trypsin-like peptidase domain-containing protein n=1 Tax=Flavobacterium sp. CS20 TaxID=2775246 RepID=UPI001B3A3C2F|nr:trypsin-like peptidase domain-containing protein [Flavobacterium sp. CS20]QTY28173.1 trypsin-like peptidase domain-containing protein [Flavobacterium sp. CS20]